MHTISRKDWSVARQPGRRLFLSQHKGESDLAFEGMGPDTLFFRSRDFESEISQLGIPPASVVRTPVSLEMTVGA